MSILRVCVVLVLAAAAGAIADAQAPDYAALYERGRTFADFLENARSRRDEWQSNYRAAVADPGSVSAVREMPDQRRLLVVADDWCSDSVNTLPYIAKLVDALPERLEMRVIDSRVGRAVMAAHRSPDGRAATPTVIVLASDGRFLGAWVERPEPLQEWFLEDGRSLSREELSRRKAAWYEKDAGRTTLEELTRLLTGPK
jgi:hypothetical protein